MMERKKREAPQEPKTPEKLSPVRAVIAWLIETDREYRVAQSMIDKTHDKL